MGYTHYYTIYPDRCSPEQFYHFIEDAKRLFAFAEDQGINIVNGDGDAGTEPEISEAYLAFNGPLVIVEVDDGIRVRSDASEGCETAVFDFRPPRRPPGGRPRKSPYLRADWDILPWGEKKQQLLTKWQAWQRYDAERASSRDFFCKTEREPYDLVVTALLIRAKVIFGDGISVASDGSDEWDWDPDAEYQKEIWTNFSKGRRFYEACFEEAAPYPFEREEAVC